MSSFDRQFYLSTNPDVAASGIDPETHYRRYGRFEGRQGCQTDIAVKPAAVSALFPGICSEIHPDDEMYKVAARNPDIRYPDALYMSTGNWIYEDIMCSLRGANINLSTVSSVLDFASGYGRVTRFWLKQFHAADVWVADVQHSAVDFLMTRFGVNGLYPLYEPTSDLFPRQFELISVVSLFSHLPEIRTKQWLISLVDALAPGGTLVFSFHGDHLLEPELRSSVGDAHMFFPSSESTVLPVSEYGTTYLSHDYLVHILDDIEGITLARMYQRGLCDFQDLAVITRSL